MLEHSSEIGSLAVALAAAQGKFDRIVKDTANPFFKSKYATLASIIDGTRKALADVKIAVVQAVEFEANLCSVTTILFHESGQWMKGMITMPVAKLDPQGVGSASTYARRYGLSAFVNVAADDDDDGNAASKPVQNQTTLEPVRKQLPEADITRLSGMLEATDTMDLLKTVYREAVQTATKAGDQQALVGFTAIKEQQKKKIEAVGAHS
jgi:ERF superfamily